MVLGGVSQFWPEVSVRGTICALYIILFGLGNALLGLRHIFSLTRDLADQLYRVPDSSSSGQICVVYVLVHWTRCLYDRQGD
jgi:hypothetical protein